MVFWIVQSTHLVRLGKGGITMMGRAFGGRLVGRFWDHALPDGREVEVGPYAPADREPLLDMYRTFDPAQRAQGIPPIDEPRRVAWVDQLSGRGINVVARREDRIVGHAALTPDRAASYELAIFVHQDFQGVGIGRRLLETLLDLARSSGVREVWLSVESWNRRAIALYKKIGFTRLLVDHHEQVWRLVLHHDARNAPDALRRRSPSSPSGKLSWRRKP